MQKKRAFLLISTVFASTFAFAVSVRQDLVEILRAEGIEREVNDAVPGNKSKAYINEAYVDLNDNGMKLYIHFVIDAEQETCVRVPFVGKRCFTSWGFETNLAAETNLDPSCKVHGVDVRKWGTSSEGLGHIVEPLIHELYRMFEGKAEAVAQKSIEKAIQSNQSIKEFCNL